MKYIVLDEPDFQIVDSSGSPLSYREVDLNDSALADARHNPSKKVVLPTFCSLISPVSKDQLTPRDVCEPLNGNTTWGICAVGANLGRTQSLKDPVKIAVLDTGLDIQHDAFRGIRFDSSNLMDFTEDNTGIAGKADDQNGHGTHVAGTIFGRDVDGVQIGVAPGIEQVLIAKVIGPDGGAPILTILNAIDWALLKGADIINMSLTLEYPNFVKTLIEIGGLDPEVAAARAFDEIRFAEEAFKNIGQKARLWSKTGRGAFLVAAAGNRSKRWVGNDNTVSTAFPAAADHFISVGALSSAANGAYQVAGFSNTGCRFSAPGVSVRSAEKSTKSGLKDESGTSTAAPHVAGVLALWIQELFPSREQRAPHWQEDVENAIEHTVRRLTPKSSRSDVGLGLIQAPPS